MMNIIRAMLIILCLCAGLAGCAQKTTTVKLNVASFREAPPDHTGSSLTRGGAGVSSEDLQGASELNPTCYDDGDCCPGGCDPHFVVHKDENGSARVHAPDSTAENWLPCKNGHACELCLGPNPSHCFVLIYRGGGPGPGRVDFTAAFWEMACAMKNVPEPVARQCGYIENAAKLLGRISCLKTPAAAGCEELIPSAARIAKEREKVRRCLERQRGDWRCYYQGRGRTLSPGSCENAAINRDGWDCCTGDSFHDACVSGCEKFYIEAQ